MSIAKHRFDAQIRAFADFLTLPAAGDWAATEADLVDHIAPLMPDASPLMRRAAVRLICHTIADPVGLLLTMSPQHIGVVANYYYGEELEESRREGESTFWLFESTTTKLKAYEDQVSPGMSAFFFHNDMLPLAMRAWLRLQAYHFNMAHAEIVREIWTAVWGEKAAKGEVNALHRGKLIDLGITPRLN